MQQERELWWLNPAWVAGVMGTLFTLAAYLVPESMYRTYWKTPKFLDGQHALETLACVAMFVLGAAVGQFRRRRVTVCATPDWRDSIAWRFVSHAFNACFYLTIVGYVVWAAAAVSRGATLSLVMGVLHGDKGASYVMKEFYLATVSGVTTLTQLAIVCMVLGVLVGKTMGWRRVIWKCALLLVLAMFRALMNSERLAVMEMLVPAIVIFTRIVIMPSIRFAGRMWTALKAAPAVGYTGLIGVFGASEYFRSWINYYAGAGMSFWQFVSLRLLGYYVTALNNGALLVQRIDPTGAPFFTLHLFWRFPILSDLANALYPNLTLASVETDPYMKYLEAEANPEFNNGGGFLLPMLDFGLAGALLYWILVGVVCGVLYRLFQEKRPAGLFLYPVVFTGVIELTRIIYWAEGRVFLPIFILGTIALVCTYYARKRPVVEPIPKEPPQWQPSH